MHIARMWCFICNIFYTLLLQQSYLFLLSLWDVMQYMPRTHGPTASSYQTYSTQLKKNDIICWNFGELRPYIRNVVFSTSCYHPDITCNEFSCRDPFLPPEGCHVTGDMDWKILPQVGNISVSALTSAEQVYRLPWDSAVY